MNKIYLIAATMLATASLQAQTVVLPNGDFEAGVANVPGGFKGFDGDSGSPDIPGWSNIGGAPLADAGVEGAGAWWGTHVGYSGFMKVGDGAFNLSTYTIQAGDEYTVSFFGKTWDANSEWTVTLFYDVPSNVIGTFSAAVNNTWAEYSNAGAIVATGDSVGGVLGVSFVNTGPGFANLDGVSIAVTAIPEPSTYAAILGALALGAVAARRRRA